VKREKRQKAKKRPNRFLFKISPLVLFMAVVFFLLGDLYLFICYMVAIVLHEMAHAEVATRLGYRLIKLKIAPFGASLIGEFESIRPLDEIKIAAAGPLSNLCFAVLAVALWWLVPSTFFISQYFVLASIYVAAFNLLPVFPLDGGRIALAIMSLKAPRQAAYKKLRIAGFVLSFVLIALFIIFLIFGIFNITFATTGIFVLISSVFPDKGSSYQRLYSMANRYKNLKSGILVKQIMVSKDTKIIKMINMLSGAYYCEFIVLDENYKRLFVIAETQLEQLYKQNDVNSQIGMVEVGMFKKI